MAPQCLATGVFMHFGYGAAQSMHLLQELARPRLFLSRHGSRHRAQIHTFVISPNGVPRMKFLPRMALALTLAGSSWLAQAAAVTANFSLITGNTWQASFTLINGAADPTAEGVTIYFDEVRYSNLGNAMAPSGWDPLVVQPSTGPLVSSGFFDALALPGNELQPGQSLAGFSVEFQCLGTGAPDAMAFEFYQLDANDLPVVLSSGITQSPAVSVPEPGALLLSSLALAALGAVRRQSRVQA